MKIFSDSHISRGGLLGPPPVPKRWSDSPYLKGLKVGSWDTLEQIPTVTVTFVQAAFVLVTFVHITNFSAVTDLI